MTFLRHYLKTQRLIICVFIGLLPILASGQVVPAPGGISGASLWSSDGDSAGFIGNYHTLNLLDLEVSAAGKIPKMEGATTLFLVLKPSFTSSTGKKFMELGDITVYDNKIMHGATWTSLDFSDGNPKILTLSMQRSSRYKTSYTPHLEIIDSSLFSLAELVYYPRLSSREQIKMVNTYLAIKYSVPITGVSDKDWRDYLAADSSRYWDYTTDKMYSLRVLGLGRSASEDLYQSQTQASHGSMMQLSLDTLKSPGQMPRVPISDAAFLIFSERLPATYSSLLWCGNKGVNPLLNWKLKPHGWDSETSNLLIHMDRPTGTLADSVWMTDGGSYYYVPQVASTSTTLTYSTPLDSVVNGLHYFFTAEKGNPCDDLEIGLAQNVLTVDMGTGIGGGITLKIHSYSTGLTIEEPLVGHEYSKSLSVGQYQVTLLDGKNNILTERAVLVRNEGQQSVEVQGPELRLLPNPVLVGATSYLEIHGLPRDTDVSIQLSGMDGKTHYQTMLPYREGMRVPLSGTVPGLYTVSVLQDGTRYSIKMLLAAH